MNIVLDEDEQHRSHIREDKNVWYYFLETIRWLCVYWVLFYLINIVFEMSFDNKLHMIKIEACL